MIDQTATASPGKIGMQLLHNLTNPAWLKQPAYDFTIFKQGERRGVLDHRAFAFNWHTELIEAGLLKYDKHAAYLAAAGSALLGVGAPIFQRGPALAPIEKRPGLWQVHIEAAPPGAPAALPPIIEEADSWQYTPVVQLLQERGYRLRIEAAHIWPESHQILRPFYDRLRAMRANAADQAALDRVKKIYTQTLGLLAHELDNPWPGCLFRPDWWFCLVALSKSVTYRQMERVYLQEQQAPIAIESDALYYAAPVQGLQAGAGIGQYGVTIVTPKEAERFKGLEDENE